MAADQQHRTYDSLKRVSDTGCERRVLGYVSGSDQLGAILAVVVLFWNLIWPFARSSSEAVVAAGQNEKSGSLAKREYWVLGPVTVRMPVIINWCKIVVSCLPAIVFVVLGLDETCDRLFYNPVCVAVALIVFGVAFILVENHNAAKQAPVEQMRDITFQMAILIGLFQLLAAAFPERRAPVQRLSVRS